jgi:DNA-binding GntR family transcriptional regulator
VTSATGSGTRFRRMSQPSLVERVAADLREAILTGRLHPGERISDARVAEEMGISRAPVREALRQLAALGLVQEEPRRGAFVRRLSRASVQHVYDCRRALESLAARRVAADPELAVHVAALQALVEEMNRASRRRDPVQMAEVDHRFHTTLCEATGNTWLTRLYAQIADQSRLMQSLDAIAHAEADAHELAWRHQPIVDAVGSGDADAAAEAVLAHIDLSERLFLNEVPDLADED